MKKLGRKLAAVMMAGAMVIFLVGCGSSVTGPDDSAKDQTQSQANANNDVW